MFVQNLIGIHATYLATRSFIVINEFNVTSAVADDKSSSSNAATSDILGANVAIYPISVTIESIGADEQFWLTLDEQQTSRFSSGASGGIKRRMYIRSRSEADFNVKRFIINSNELILEAYGYCDEISISFFVVCDLDILLGGVYMPRGAVITLQGDVDRTTIGGSGSFALKLR